MAHYNGGLVKSINIPKKGEGPAYTLFTLLLKVLKNRRNRKNRETSEDAKNLKGIDNAEF